MVCLQNHGHGFGIDAECSTGAMRPYEFRDTDAMQSVTEALIPARLLDSGVYAVVLNRVLPFPGADERPPSEDAHSQTERS